MLFIYRFIKGFLIIRFSGQNAEKILNICAKNNLNIWNMRYKKGYITARTDINSFKKLRIFKRGLKVKLKIIKKSGVPFFLMRYKNRVGILVGAVIFIAVLELLSGYIWNIEIKGNKRIPTTELLNECKELNIYESCKSKNIDTKNDAQRLILKDGRIAWCSLNIEGSCLTVNITETKKESGLKNSPSNIKAATDGIITKIHATEGDVKVKQGDVVAKGDILISGVIEKLNSTLFARSIGDITAETEHTFEAQRNYTEIKNLPIGENKTKKFIKIYGVNFPLFIGKIKNISLNGINEKNVKITGKKIPLTVYEIDYKDTEKVSVNHSKDELIKLLRNDIENKVKQSDFLSYEETGENIFETEKGLKITKNFKCSEIISYEESIFVG